MSKYLRSTVKSYDFDGESVTVTLSPILFEDTMRFSLVSSSADDARIIETTQLFQELLPKYIQKIDLKAGDGSPVEISELCSAAYFMPLVVQIGADLIAAGSPQNPMGAGEQ